MRSTIAFTLAGGCGKTTYEYDPRPLYCQYSPARRAVRRRFKKKKWTTAKKRVARTKIKDNDQATRP
jgi:hypothetical protein